jgi:hypothetical protein
MQQHTHEESINRNKDHMNKYHKKQVPQKQSEVLPTHINHPQTLGWAEGKDLNLEHYQADMEDNVKNSHIRADQFKPTQDEFINKN